MYTGGKEILNHDINLQGFRFTLNGEPVNIDLLKRRRVYCADADHKQVFKNWSIYKCLYAEIDHDGKKFILNDGKWFNVSVNFVERTNSEFQKIDSSPLELPVYAGGGEGKYNKDVCEQYPTRFALLDDKNKISHGGVAWPGRGLRPFLDKQGVGTRKNLWKIETCLSHLFSQGFVSGQLLQVDGDFRKKSEGQAHFPIQ